MGRRRHPVIVEIDDAVRLRPHADLSRYRCWQGVLQVELAVQIALDFRSADPHLQILPLPAWGWRIANPLHSSEVPPPSFDPSITPFSFSPVRSGAGI